MDEIRLQKERTKNALVVKKDLQSDMEAWDWHQNETGQQGHLSKNIIQLPKAGEIQIEEADAQEVQVEARSEYIGFDKAYTQVQESDSTRMAKIRVILKEYMDRTEEYNNQANNMSGINKNYELVVRLEILKDLQAACEDYRHNRHPFFRNTYGKKRKREVIALEEKVKEVHDKVSREYLSHMENEFTRLAGMDPQIRKREFRMGQDKYVSKDVQLIKGKELNLYPLTYRAYTDSAQGSMKYYLALKAEKDAKRTDVVFSREEKALLKKIGEYAKIVDIGRQIAKAKTYFFGNASLLKKQKQEGKLYKEITQELTAQIESEQSEDKKRLLEKYLIALRTDTQGTLDVPTDAQVMDFTNIRDYQYTETLNSKDGNIKFRGESAEIVNRKEEPIFAHAPCVSDVVQNSIGDCFFLSSLSECVAEDPKMITSMIHEEADGNVVVKLFHHYFTNADKEEHFVPVYFKMDKKVSARTNDGALWVSLLCKAYMLYLNNYEDDPSSKYKQALRNRNRGRQNMADYGMINSGASYYVYPVLTGNKSKALGLKNFNVEGAHPAVIVWTDYFEKHDSEETKNKLADGSIFDEESAMIADDGMVYYYHKNPIHDNFLASEKDAKKRTDYFEDYAMCISAIIAPLLKAKPPADAIKYFEEIKAKIQGLNDSNRVEAMIRGDQRAGSIFDTVLNRSQQQKKVLIQKMVSDAVFLIDEAIQKYPSVMPKKEIFSGEYTKAAEDLFDEIKDAREKGIFVIAGTKKGESMGVFDNPQVKGVVYEHAYSVLGTQEVTYNGKTIKMVRLRNPWGHYTVSYRKNKKGKVEAYESKTKGDNGEFLMEFNHFLKEFVQIETGSGPDANPAG